jgi:two-component system, OmpR family, sensor histidine kinase KdpD
MPPSLSGRLAGPPLSRRRRIAGFGLALGGLPLLTLVAHAAGLGLTGDIPLLLGAVVAVALVGGRWPGLVAALGGFLLLNYYFVPPLHTLRIGERSNLVALAVFVVVALAVSWMVDLAARRTRQAEALASVAEGDRVRAALLAAVGHDLRTPLASATAAVAGLRSTDVQLDDVDREELLATAAESLDRLSGLVSNLLDMSRLEAGTLGMSPADVGLDDVTARALDELGPDGRRFEVRLPDDLPAVRADPGLLERIIVNLAANALRFSPSSRPPLVTGAFIPADHAAADARSASGRAALASRPAPGHPAPGHPAFSGDLVELRIVDHGPGIPEEQWELVFRPFQRLGDRDNHRGVGLGLALARGLAEAMGGRLTPAATPGGGLTMILALPAGVREPRSSHLEGRQ